ncbi:hypothetical protein LTR95_001045 [Oleoguttula sp. CCFEE 5521]
MYEEEDDDLPMQYRRLTAHLQIQNADFDRRLAAYLTNHVAMRSALGQAVSDAWQNNQFNNISQLMNPKMMQMPMQGQTAQQQQHAFNNPMMPPQQQQQPQPQPTAGQTHVTASATGSSQDTSVVHRTHDIEQRRFTGHVKDQLTHEPGNGSRLEAKFAAAGTCTARLSIVAAAFAGSFPVAVTFDPLSATLPMSTQQLLAGAPADLNLSSMFMPPQQQQTQYNKPSQQPFYSYNPNGKSKSSSSSLPSYSNMPQQPIQGMNQTLSMSMLDKTAPSPTCSRTTA